MDEYVQTEPRFTRLYSQQAVFQDKLG